MRLTRKETNNTPGIILDFKKPYFEVRGKSFPENSRSFYQPVKDWLGEVEVEQGTAITLQFYLDYVSSSSLIAVLELFRKFEELKKKFAMEVDVVWHYEEGDDDVLKIGNDYEELLTFPFSYVEEEEVDED